MKGRDGRLPVLGISGDGGLHVPDPPPHVSPRDAVGAELVDLGLSGREFRVGGEIRVDDLSPVDIDGNVGATALMAFLAAAAETSPSSEMSAKRRTQ